MAEKTLANHYSSFSKYFKQLPEAEVTQPVTTELLVQDTYGDAYFFRDMEKSGFGLNQHQLEAVRTTEGPLLIDAGAGSGKTSTIIARAAYLLRVMQVPANQILLVTFTKKASEEMKERIEKFPGLTPHQLNGLTVVTFHSIFLRILRENGVKHKVLSSDRMKHILLKNIMKKMGLKDEYNPESIAALISYYKNNMHTPDMLATKTEVQKEVKEIYVRYEEWKEDDGYIDFDDILLICLQMFDWNPELLNKYQEKFRYIIVDESQDTCPVQYEIIRRLTTESGSCNLCLVGDVDQTLYRFRAAEPKFMLSFSSEFRGTSVIPLDVNYRSSAAIVGLGNAIIRHNKERLDKTLKAVRSTTKAPMFSRPFDEDAEAQNIIERIQEKQRGDQRLNDTAVLYRSHSNSRAVVDALVHNNIPFILHGTGNSIFYEQSFVKPILAVLRAAIEPENEEAIKGASSIMYMKREVVTRLLEEYKASDRLQRDYKGNALTYVFDEMGANLGGFQYNQLINKQKLIEKLHQETPLNAIRLIRTGAIGYDKMLEMDDKKTLTLHKEILLEMLNTLEHSARKFKSIEDYLMFVDKVIEMSAEMEKLKKIPNYNAVQLMTIHGAKGLEFESVFVVGVVEGVLPHKSSLTADKQNDRVTQQSEKNVVVAAIEEERRILYVGVTRAKNELYVSAPLTYQGKEKPVSRFLIEALGEKNNKPST